VSELDLVVRSRRAVLPSGERPAAVCVRDGRIAAVREYGERLSAAREHDLDTVALLPGLVDPHVHVNEPGRTEWEGFASATAAAAAGGVTTLIDMPLNSIPPTVDVEALRLKRKAALGQCWVNVGFWGGAVPGNLGDLARLHEAGVFGFKCFTAPSGVDEFPPLSWAELRDVLAETARLDAVLLVHAEDPDELGTADGSLGRHYADFLASRPSSAEDSAIDRVLSIAATEAARVHILHLSSASALPLLARARASGQDVTVETCPHYLALAAEDVPNAATAYKCCPPIRHRENADELWEALRSGLIDSVVSDHSPCPAELKQAGGGDFGLAWGGIASLQLGLPVVWSEARRRGHGLADVLDWMSATPAQLVGLDDRGSIAPGNVADLVAFDPDAEFVVDGAQLRHRHPVTPYATWRLRGRVLRTWLDGREIVCTPGTEPAGGLLRRDGR
jgi:allantoinase